MRLDSHNFSPAILGKITRAAVRHTSFAAAAESLVDEAEVDISARQTDRIAHEVGVQLQRARDRRVEQFRSERAVPEAPVVPRLAVIAVDGGRLNTRCEEPGHGPGVRAPAWREDKVANFVTMNTKCHDHDPHPELPRCLTHKESVVELVQGIAGQGALADVVEPTDKAPPALSLFEPAATAAEPSWPPEPLVRTAEATLGSSEEFAPMVVAEARRRNFFAAQARVFLGDGGAWIWTLQRAFFPTFEPVLDFVHALTHVYVAAKAVGGGTVAVWDRYVAWAGACWRGEVATVLEQLNGIWAALPPPEEPDEVKPTDPYEVIRQTIVYLTNNRARMDYPRYRRAGLPTCSGLVESLVKQFNRRVKGTEKFWNATRGEAVLQLRAAYLCEDDRLKKHMATRAASPYRRYETAKRKKAG